MKMISKTSAVSSCLMLIALTGLAQPGRATEWDKKTIMTLSEPLQVPHMLLAPGTYVFKLEDSDSNRHIVKIFDKNEQHLITTIMAIPNYRLRPRGRTEFAFWETPAGTPRALRAWFYPGDNFGQEFAYPKTLVTQITSTNHTETVPEDTATTTVAENTVVASAPEPAAETAPVPAPEPKMTAAAEPPPQPEPAPQPTPVAPQELPHTASAFPLIGMIGLLSLAAFGVLSFRAKRAL